MYARACPLIAALALVLGGCAGDGPVVVTTSNDWFSRLQREVFNPNCLSAGCHNPQSQAGGLVLSEGFSYNNLVIDSEPTNPTAQAAGLRRVLAFEPTQSFLFIKVTNPAEGEGDRMPLGAAPLSAADINLIDQWILAGAPPAQTPTPPTGATATPTATETPPLPTATPTSPAPTIPPPTVPPASTPTTSPSPTPTQLVTLAEVQALVFTPHCLTIGCHTSTFQAGSLVLENGVSFTSLVNVPAANGAAMNAGLVRVSPGSPAASFLLTKLTDPFPPQGSRMPLGQPKLSDELIALVRAWIAQGANP